MVACDEVGGFGACLAGRSAGAVDRPAAGPSNQANWARSAAREVFAGQLRRPGRSVVGTDSPSAVATHHPAIARVLAGRSR